MGWTDGGRRIRVTLCRGKRQPESGKHRVRRSKSLKTGEISASSPELRDVHYSAVFWDARYALSRCLPPSVEYRRINGQQRPMPPVCRFFFSRCPASVRFMRRARVNPTRSIRKTRTVCTQIGTAVLIRTVSGANISGRYRDLDLSRFYSNTSIPTVPDATYRFAGGSRTARKYFINTGERAFPLPPFGKYVHGFEPPRRPDGHRDNNNSSILACWISYSGGSRPGRCRGFFEIRFRIASIPVYTYIRVKRAPRYSPVFNNIDLPSLHFYYIIIIILFYLFYFYSVNNTEVVGQTTTRI